MKPSNPCIRIQELQTPSAVKWRLQKLALNNLLINLTINRNKICRKFCAWKRIKFLVMEALFCENLIKVRVSEEKNFFFDLQGKFFDP